MDLTESPSYVRVQNPPISAHASSLRLLRRGASGAFVVSVCGTGLGFLANLVIARVIGRDEYGIYALMFSWISVLAVMAQAGQDISMIRFVPTYIRNGAWGKIHGLRRGVGALVLVISVCVAIVGCVVVNALGAKHGQTWRDAFYIGFVLLPIWAQLQLSGALHRAFKRPVVMGMYQTIARPLLLIAQMGIFALMLPRVTASWAAAATAVTALLALAGSALHISKKWPPQARNAKPEYELRQWVKVGSQLSLLSIFNVAGNRLDVLILGALMGSADVGPYFVAVRIASFTLFAQQAINAVLAPMIAELYDAKDIGGLREITARASRMGFAGALAVSVLFTWSGPWILERFGHGFGVAYVPLLVLLWGFCAASALGEVGFMLSMTKYQKQSVMFVVIGIVVNCTAAILLVPRLGATGAAVGAVLLLLVWRVLAWRFVVKHLGVDPSIFGMRRNVVLQP